jgi:hypothetical protein
MRILFAAARGARIETQYQYPKKKWGAVAGIRTDHFYLYRIHRDDVHLQYGPISTALHELELWELEEDNVPSLAIHSLLACRLDSDWLMTWYQQDIGERALAILIMAEALADEGL